ncbi:zinc finger protein 518A [Monodelphis domestica]|uniref:zinc finger protein 518A n=1 Tax=Monodelphis domestica TaxID=13616 RepID=UPI0024E1C265|nr:zinc finger protein 518A [Monodelphis domestica]XP_056657717.1 zinc finger protein 518A [Monodelphis domestica]XP_056657718.1 zinc finger protein 518A [Monodelphis domestica]XP_056657725.1 zinc finger protein 518A [Monodelphis domestica]
MPSEQKQFFCDEKPTTLEKGYDVEDIIVIDAVESEEPRILEDNSLYELKNVKIDLPKISISDETPLTHEVDTYKQVFESKPQTARKSVGKEKINESPLNCLEECNMLQRPNIRFEEEGMKMSAKILNFSCTKCRDNVRYSPNDLQKHFQLLHCGELPLYPCEMCSFSANDFQSFKQHRLIHRSTLVKCDICNDENVYTLLDLTKHFAVKHCVNGNFQCEKCKFSTKDVGTFVQHIHRHNEIHYKCSKCNHISFTKGEFQQHLFVHSTTFPFSCQYCNYSAAEKDQLVKHVVALHKDQLYAKDKLEKEKCEKRIVKTTAGLKLILRRYKIGTSRKTLWRQKKENNGNDSYVEKNTEVLKNINKIQFKSEEQSNIQEHLNEEKNDTIHIEKPSQKQDESESETRNLLPTSQSSRSEEGSSSGFGFLKNVIHGPAVLMLKNNKISVPANYSAKFMGFKMVDGKQHIVIKLLPTNKSNSCSPGLQPGTIKDNTTDVQHRTAETTGLPTGATLHTSELNNTICTNTSNPLSFSTPLFSGNGTSEKEKTVLAQTRSKSQTVGAEKSTPLLSTNSELTAAPLNLTTKIRISNNVGAWGSCVIQSHPQVLCATVKNPVNVESVEVNSVEPKAQHSGILNNSSINDLNYMPFSGQGSLPFHNYSKMDYLDNSCSISATAHENSEESSSSKTAVHQYSSRSESGLSSVGMSPNPDLHETSPSKICETYCPLNTKDTCEPLKNQCEDTEILETIQNIDTQNPQADINQGLEDVAEKSDWENISCVDSFTMPKITSVFSLQSTQASDFWSPEETQLLQNVLDEKLSLGKDSDITPNKGVQLHDEPLLKNEGKSNITEYLKGSESPCTLPISSSNVGISVHTKDLNASNCIANTEMGCGKEKQVLSTSNDLGDSEKIPRIAVVDSVKTQSDTRITQQLVKDKIQATPDSSNGLGSFHVLSPPINSEPKKAIFVQSSPKGFILPLHLASKSGLKLVSGRSLSSTNPPGILMTKGIPSSLLLNKKPGMILRLSNGVLGSVTNITGENSQVLGGAIAKEDDKTPSVRADLKKDSPTNIICSSTFDSRPDMAVSSENSIPFKGSYIFRNPAESSVNENSSQNTVPGCQSTKSQSLGSVRQPSEAQQKQSLYALLPDGRQAVLLRCVTPSKSQVGPSDLLQNSTYDHQNHQPKKSGATQQKILLKIIKNPAFDNSQSAKSPKSSLQLDIIQSHQTSTAEEKQLVSSSDALLLTNRLMPANATVTTSTAICNIPPQGTVCTTTHPETQLLRCQTNSSFRSGFNHGKSTRRQISKMKAHVQHKASESMITYENRNFGPKCRDNFQEWPRKKVMLHRKSKRKTKSEDFHDTFDLYRPRFPKDTVRTLRLFPFSSTQLIKCPRRNQPVVVLNHPDTDSPEVVNVMKTIAKFKGQVVKVSLSKRTIQALLEPAYCNISKAVTDYFSAKRHKVLKPVKERFVLKLTLKKTSKNNYQIVKTTSDNTLKAKFNCWYCGRVFDNQDAWVGHGQRHLMEATRDWHMLE